MIDVVVGIILKDNQVCITKRKKNTHLAGLWEFPGGKLEPSETPEKALIRELYEEVNIKPTHYKPYNKLTYQYPECSVALNFYLVEQYAGELLPNENQQLRWVNINELHKVEFPEVNIQIVNQLVKDFC